MSFSIQRDGEGRIESAVLRQAEGETLRLNCTRRLARNTATFSIDFHEGAQKFLTTKTQFRVKSGCAIVCVEQVTVEAKSDDVQYKMLMDLRRAGGTTSVPIKKMINGKEREGKIDLNTMEVSGLSASRDALVSTLSDVDGRRLDKFLPVLEELGRFDPPSLDPSTPLVLGTPSVDAKLWCEVLIVGISGGAAASCCVGTAGIGCPICAGIVSGGGAFAASLCP